MHVLITMHVHLFHLCFRLSRYEKTNEMLINFNLLSSSRYEVTVKEFQNHTQLLSDMKRDLDSIFKRIRYSFLFLFYVLYFFFQNPEILLKTCEHKLVNVRIRVARSLTKKFSIDVGVSIVVTSLWQDNSFKDFLDC